MYVLGAMLVLAGLNMLAGLVNARRLMPVAWGFYVVPVLILAAGIVVLFNPFRTAELPFIVLGVTSIVYGVFDMFEAYKFRRTGVEIIEETEVSAGAPALEQTPSAEETDETSKDGK